MNLVFTRYGLEFRDLLNTVPKNKQYAGKALLKSTENSQFDSNRELIYFCKFVLCIKFVSELFLNLFIQRQNLYKMNPRSRAVSEIRSCRTRNFHPLFRAFCDLGDFTKIMGTQTWRQGYLSPKLRALQ